MPYVEVWVDPVEVCTPCAECERRDEADEQRASDIEEVIREWHFAKSRGNYEHFERLLISLNGPAWDRAIYGDRTGGPATRERERRA